MRFDLESKPETKSAELIKSVFDDLFFEDSDMIVVFYGNVDKTYKEGNHKWQVGKRYFKKFSLKKILQKSYTSKDEDSGDENPYLVACLTKRNKFNLKKFLSGYLEDEQSCQMAFVSLKKGATIQLYDSRGFDLLSADKDLLKLLYKRYEEDIIEYNREEIREALDI
ncbi:MAG: DUF3885 domain-containing protein [Clostridiales bacterium]|nr:DUF3885 domain-containing protein [Clostridiales bacterium]